MSTSPSPSQSPYAPAPEGGTKILLLVLSFFIPIVGIVIGIVYLQRPDPASQAFARQALIAAASFFGVFCLCFACYFIFVFVLGFAPLLFLPFVTPEPGGAWLVAFLFA